MTTVDTPAKVDLRTSVKSALRPLNRVRLAAERAKYLGTPILGPESGNDLLARTLLDGLPTAAAKIGGSELRSIRHYLKHRDSHGRVEKWSGNDTRVYNLSGVFPLDPVVHSRFSAAYLEAIREVNVLSVWFRWGERSITRSFADESTYVALRALEPFFHPQPWSAALAGKRVLVVSPFGDTIMRQYERRTEVWAAHPAVLPAFDLDVMCPPQYASLVEPVDRDWFAALERLKAEMSARTWDAAIIGAGAWSLPLVVHARRLGRWAVHMGGATQLLFGIRGGRWDANDDFAPFFNSAWTRPSEAERPGKFTKVEGGCYW